MNTEQHHEVLTLAGGCYWCVEAPLRMLAGVQSAVSGFMGGHVANPSYEQVCEGTTGHAEVVQLHYDPLRLSCHDLLEVFFTLHDPTTRNRQGNDIGPQYRSAVFYHTPEQRDIAYRVIEEFTRNKVWPDPIVTDIAPAGTFYPAHDEHQRYFERNQAQPYCLAVIVPKVVKLRARFADKLRGNTP